MTGFQGPKNWHFEHFVLPVAEAVGAGQLDPIRRRAGQS
jgi:hypothetical protein